MSHTETITWVPCAERLPDAELNVLAFDAQQGQTMEAFLDCDDNGLPLWRDVTALTIHGVTHWADLPLGPGA